MNYSVIQFPTYCMPSVCLLSVSPRKNCLINVKIGASPDDDNGDDNDNKVIKPEGKTSFHCF